MSVSAQQVAELRRRTNAGMMDCKKALNESNGDMEQAIALLKEWGIAKASKKGDRGANEGVLVSVVSEDQTKAMLIEVNCETDFVSNTAEYKEFAKQVADMIFKQGISSKDDIKDDIKERLAQGISQFGENIIIGSIKMVQGEGIVGSYIHSNFKNGTIVMFEGNGNLKQEAILNMAKDIAVHISANTVQAVDEQSLDQALINSKKEEYLKEVKEQGKPDNIAEKIVEGKMNKFFKEETLLGQPFFKNEDITIKELLKQVGKDCSVELNVKCFVKTIIGE